MTGWSQDTVAPFIRGNYFYNALPDIRGDILPRFVAISGSEGCGISAKEMYTYGKPLRVYGMAAAMVTMLDVLYLPPNIYELDPDFDTAEWFQMTILDNYRDTSLDESYEYLLLCVSDYDSLRILDSVRVHRKYDTAAYYVATGIQGNGSIPNPNFVYPMYEQYFDLSIMVLDTFYVGVTQRSATGGETTFNHMCFWLLEFQGQGCQSINEYHVNKLCYSYDTHWWWPLRQQTSNEYYMIFPILTPKPGSQNPDNPDPESVTEADMVSRYVTVQPNPAEKEARVLSSFGLERIEAYDGGGRQVLAREASGLAATIDVSSWPCGTYLLRITTPMGTTTKKLLVQ